jgi:hypothetical protein
MTMQDTDVTARTEGLRALLRNTLMNNAESASCCGPWSALFAERDIWQGDWKLNQRLFRNLSATFDKNQVRELLLAAAGVKVSRTCVQDDELEVLRSTADFYGFSVSASEHRWLLHGDAGKGGWANTMERSAEPHEPGVTNVYVAKDNAMAQIAKMLDEAGEDDLFGALLGIPACCRHAFVASKPRAAKQQNDFVPFVMERTPEPFPHDWRLNYLAQYFGPSLLSFFPCSFVCPAAAAIAQTSLELLRGCDAALAAECTSLQKTNVLYTEHAGLHLFQNELRDGVIAYAPDDLLSTENTALATLLRSGNSLRITGRETMHVYCDSTLVAELSEHEITMCAFNCA